MIGNFSIIFIFGGVVIFIMILIFGCFSDCLMFCFGICCLWIFLGLLIVFVGYVI